jgi:peroxiredoxin
MNSKIKNQITFLLLSAFVLLLSCSKNPQDLLEETQNKLFGHNSLSYKQSAFYPNPVGKIDTIETSIFFNKSERSFIGYDFLTKSKNADDISIDGEFNTVNHDDKIVILNPQNEIEKEKIIINNRNVKYSPITLLREADWKFVSDTLINNIKFIDYYKVETDTIINGNNIYTEQHIFVNTSSKLLERFERRNYFKGKLGQTVVFEYSNYNFDNSGRKLAYNYPLNYSSVPYGKTNTKTLLKEGDEAPIFIGNDLQNKSLNLSDYRGKKVLLDFSVINCGYCKQALDHFNQSQFQFSDKISAIYINPIDNQNDVENYVDKITVPFSVIANAKDIGDKYGVYGYPTFFLIDEKGIIEKVILGYDKDFFESLKRDEKKGGNQKV